LKSEATLKRAWLFPFAVNFNGRGQVYPRHTCIGHTSAVSGIGLPALSFLIAFRHED
jgi:hypothetical protein